MIYSPDVALPVFCPDSRTPDVSGAIDLRHSGSADHLVMHLRDAAAVTIEGQVRPSASVPASGAILKSRLTRGLSQ